MERFKGFLRNLRQLPLFLYEKGCFCIKKDALAILLQPLTNAGFFHADKALFYLGLAQLRLGNVQAARYKFLQMPAEARFKGVCDSILTALN
jgi:hypothetical protein